MCCDCFVTPCSLAGGYQRCAGPWCSGTDTWYSLRDFFWDSWLLENGPIGCPETSVRSNHHRLRNVAEECISDGTVGLKRWYKLDQTGSCLPANGLFNVVLSSLKCGSTTSTVTEWSPVVTIYTASLTFSNSTFCPHSVFMCFVWIWEQTAIILLYSIDWLVFRRSRKLQKRRLASSCLSVGPQEQLCYLCADFHAIRYMRIFVKSVGKIKFDHNLSSA